MLWPRSRRIEEVPTASPRDVTALLGDWSRGDRTALTELLPVVYAELRRVAARQLRNERADHTLQPTALVHEVYIRLVGQRQVDWQNRRTSLASRRRSCAGSSSITPVVTPQANEVTASTVCPSTKPETSPRHRRDPSSRWITRSIALKRWTLELAKIVELRAFGGLTIEEAARILIVSPSTAKREWRAAKAWLTRDLGAEVQLDGRAMAASEGAVSCGLERPSEERDAFVAACDW